MREIRQSGSEGGGTKPIVSSYPYIASGEAGALLLRYKMMVFIHWLSGEAGALILRYKMNVFVHWLRGEAGALRPRYKMMVLFSG